LSSHDAFDLKLEAAVLDFVYPTDYLPETSYPVPEYVEPEPTSQKMMINEVVNEETMRHPVSEPLDRGDTAVPPEAPATIPMKKKKMKKSSQPV
jgi:hypothetical protein